MRSFRRRVRLAVASLLALSAFAIAQRDYFPKKALADDSWSDQFRADWYSSALKDMGEPSLFELATSPSAESYRFLWLRTFHHPVAIRVDVRADGTGVLTKKVRAGSAGFPSTARQVIENESRPLLRAETQGFLARLKIAGFWSLPGQFERGGMDGSQWIIEGAKGGKYHVVDR